MSHESYSWLRLFLCKRALFSRQKNRVLVSCVTPELMLVSYSTYCKHANLWYIHSYVWLCLLLSQNERHDACICVELCDITQRDPDFCRANGRCADVNLANWTFLSRTTNSSKETYISGHSAPYSRQKCPTFLAKEFSILGQRDIFYSAKSMFWKKPSGARAMITMCAVKGRDLQGLLPRFKNIGFVDKEVSFGGHIGLFWLSNTFLWVIE